MRTPQIAVTVLSALPEAGHDVVGVYGQPDRPRGRGRAVEARLVKRYAIEHGLRIHQPRSLASWTAQEQTAVAARRNWRTALKNQGQANDLPLFTAPHPGMRPVRGRSCAGCRDKL